MNTLVSSPEVAKDKHQINLIDGCFTASEAQEILTPMIAKKINFHQVKRMSLYETDHSDSCTSDRNRIVELEEAKIKAEDIFLQAKLEGKKIKMESIIQITLED
ncbi:hypothetical protein [uncultured Dokdonia sp.]|uniref:hypothetical protein n=1 Tax=uncultured Dokdonia sp. TaxID=575653 RepID=UPI002613079B|nr:hypothetical protein [uncultured Dokdonia sp.]